MPWRELETVHLVMRPIEERDSPCLYPLINDAEVARTLINVPHPYPEQDFGPWMRECLDAMGRRERLDLAIVLRATGEPIGICSLLHLDWEKQSGQLAYWLGRPYWDQGLMTEAIRRLLEFAFERYGLVYVRGCCLPGNTASARVMKKVGMTYIAHARHAIEKNGEMVDAICYEMSLEDYRARR